MRKGIGAIQADGNSFHSGFDNLLCNRFRDLCAVCRQCHAQTALGRKVCEIEDVVAVQRLATAKHKDGVSEVGDLLDDIERAPGGKIGGRTQLGRGCAAMNASQVAALGYLPENEPRFEFLHWMRVGFHPHSSGSPPWGIPPVPKTRKAQPERL